MATWVKQSDDPTAHRIYPRKVAPLAIVAPGTSQGEILFFGLPLMSNRGDVIDLMPDPYIILVDVTIFTPSAGALEHQQSQTCGDVDTAHNSNRSR